MQNVWLLEPVLEACRNMTVFRNKVSQMSQCIIAIHLHVAMHIELEFKSTIDGFQAAIKGTGYLHVSGRGNHALLDCSYMYLT